MFFPLFFKSCLISECWKFSVCVASGLLLRRSEALVVFLCDFWFKKECSARVEARGSRFISSVAGGTRTLCCYLWGKYRVLNRNRIEMLRANDFP